MKIKRTENSDHRLPVCDRPLLAWLVIVMSFMGWTSIAQQAKAAVYWGNSMFVGAADFDRTAVEFAYWPWPPNEPPASSAVFGEISGVAVNSKYLFWINSAGFIQRVNLDGPTTTDVVVSGISNPCGLTATESEVYWTSCSAATMGRNTLGRAKVDGSNATTLISKLLRPCDVAVHGQNIYWTDLEGIARANLDGSEVVAGFVPATGGPCGGLTVTDQHIYWGDWGRTIGRSSIDGDEVNDRFISTAGAVKGLAADSTSIFWINDYEDGRPATIGRADIGGAGADQAWVTNNRSNPRGMAVDARSRLAPLPPPAREISFGKVRHDRRTGSVFLDAWTWEGGELTVIAPHIGWKVMKGSGMAFEDGVLRQRLKLWPGKKSVRGHSIRQRLKSKGRAKVTLWVRYWEAGRTPIFKRTRLSFSRKRTFRALKGSDRKTQLSAAGQISR